MMYSKQGHKEETYLRYPADWVIRFHNMYLKKNVPKGRVLDYGCGSGNNSIFFIQKGYEVYGVDIENVVLDLVEKNLRFWNVDTKLVTTNFSIITPDSTSLPFADGFFDFILSNQVLCYLPSEEQIKKICKEFSRCLRPGGVVFFTMMGPKNYYITHHAKQIHGGRYFEISIDDPAHRLYGLRELIYLVRDVDELKSLFSEFECVSTGYFDQSMLDMVSNFYWIFIGKKRS